MNETRARTKAACWLRDTTYTTGQVADLLGVNRASIQRAVRDMKAGRQRKGWDHFPEPVYRLGRLRWARVEIDVFAKHWPKVGRTR